MQEINRAYEVLTHPFKRKLYDKYGVESVALYEGGTIPEMLWKIIFIVSNPKFILLVGLFLVFIFILVLSTPILIGLQLDDEIQLNWTIVFIPLFLIDILIFVLLLVISLINIKLSLNENVEGTVEADSFLHETPKRKLSFAHILEFISVLPITFLFIFEVLLALQLDKTIIWSWWIIFAPLLIAQLIVSLQNIPNVFYSRYKVRSSTQFYCKLGYIGFIIRHYYTDFLFLLTTLLFTYNLANSPDLSDLSNGVEGKMSWWIVFSPLLTWVFIGFSLSLIENCFYSKLVNKEFKKNDEEGDDQIMENLPFLLKAFNVFCSCVYYAFILVLLILFIVWISSFEYSAFIVFIPIFILITLLCCCCSCAYVFVFYSVKSSNNENNDNNNFTQV